MRIMPFRAVVAPVTCAVLVALAVTGGAAPALAAPGGCTGTTTVTCTYTSAGLYSFSVPAGVTSLDVTAVGAAGGAGDGTDCVGSNAAGGPGASVEDTAVPVTADQGQALTVVVGGTGGAGTINNGGAGGSPGGGGPGGDYPDGSQVASCEGGGGGGYSGLLDPSGAALVIAAAGGGGGGGSGGASSGGPGDTGSGGGPGVGADCGTGGCGGGGGTGTMGGAGGAAGAPRGAGAGGNGTTLAGGQGGTAGSLENSSGGGGGGGYFGGGGGGGGGGDAILPVANGGAGGGGGSSFVAGGLANEATATTAALVTISYQVPPAPADLSIANAGSPNPAVSGDHLTYTITAANTGGQDATQVTVTDPLPRSAHFDSMSTSQGSCTRTAGTRPKTRGGTVACGIGTLAGGASATVTIVVTPTGKPGPLADTATVTASDINPPDSDDSATATVTVHGT